MKKFFENDPRLLAHRGNSLEYPENTLISFRNAVKEIGVDVIETDTHLSKDNEFIISHDLDISRVSNNIGKISNFTYERLLEFDAGYNFTKDGGKTFPFRGKGVKFFTVREALEKFPNQKFNIDLKDKNQSQVKLWVDILKEYQAIDRVLTASQHTKNLTEVRRLIPNNATSFSAGEVFRFYIKNKFGGLKRLRKTKFGGDALQVPIKLAGLTIVTEKSIRNVHSLGYKIHVWTINEKETMKKLFSLGVDGIFTDNPKLLKQVIEEIFK